MDLKCFTLNSWTPITANINCSRYVTNIMLPIVLIATITHFTTYYISCAVQKIYMVKTKTAITKIRNEKQQFEYKNNAQK